jgi:DnaK suppressor protein
MALNVDAQFLSAALAGYQQALEEIEVRTADLQMRIGGAAPVAAAPTAAPAKKKRRLSAEGRARIVAATRKRWAAVRKAKAEAAAAASKPAAKAVKTAAKPVPARAKKRAKPVAAVAKAPKAALKPAIHKRAVAKQPPARKAKAAPAAPAPAPAPAVAPAPQPEE